MTTLPSPSTVVPESWLPDLHAHRGLGPVPPVEPDADAGPRWRDLVAGVRAAVEKVVGDREVDGGMAEAAARYLDGGPDPRGAAVVASVVLAHRSDQPWGDRDRKPAELDAAALTWATESSHPKMPDEERTRRAYEDLVDAWTAEGGLPFAAAAFTEAQGIVLERDTKRPYLYSRYGPIRAMRAEGPAEPTDGFLRGWQAGRRLRNLLAAAPDPVYLDAVDRLAALRATPIRRAVTAYLAPTRTDWVDAWCAEPPPNGRFHLHVPPLRVLLLCSLRTADQVAALGDIAGSHESVEFGVLPTLAVAGPALVPVLVRAVVAHDRDVSVLAAVPDDAAVQALLEHGEGRGGGPALRTALRNFPARTLRVAAQAASRGGATGTYAAERLEAWSRAEPRLLADTLAGLPGPLPDVVRSTLGKAAPDCDPSRLPTILVYPVWARPGKRPKPVTVPGLTPPGEVTTRWADGVREEWENLELYQREEHFITRDIPDWETRLDQHRRGVRVPGETTLQYMYALAPADLVRDDVAGWSPPLWWDNDTDAAQRLIAKFETAMYPYSLALARANPRGRGHYLLPFRSPDVAAMMAGWLVRLPAVRRTAVRWLDWHGTDAARLLVPPALGRAGADRRAAEAALRELAARHGHDTVLTAAREYGDRATDAIGTLLDTNPLDVRPPAVPRIPQWGDPDELPPVLLRDRAARLPSASVGHLLTMLAISSPDAPYAGLAAARDACDPTSLAGFGWAVFRAWQGAGMPSKHTWAFTQLGLTGDDETARRLTPLLRRWPGEGGHKRAATGLDVLAAIGTDAALAHLDQIARKVRYKALRTRASEKIEEIAEGRGLTRDQLADRLIQDFGLDAAGTLVLDYGPRSFTAGFDEQLRPFVLDGSGRRRASLPKPGAADDPERAAAARERFKRLKADVRGTASDLVARLERGMVERRRWEPEEFTGLLVRHPLVRHLVRRLVWQAHPAGGGPAHTFRVAEDLTFAGLDDTATVLPPDARIGLAHPIELGGERGAWAELMADYEIAQPFPQLDRDVHRLTGAERGATRLERFEGITVPTGELLRLTNRDWERGEPLDAGIEHGPLRRLGPDRYMVMRLDPGFVAGSVQAFDDHRLDSVYITDHPYGSPVRTGARLGDLDEITASELLRDLTDLTAHPA